MACEEAVHEVMARTFSQYGRADLRSAGREPAAIGAMMRRIAEGVAVGEDLSLSDLADGAGLNPSYLIRATVRATCLTPHGNVFRARIDHARSPLLDRLPAAEAAIAADF